MTTASNDELYDLVIAIAIASEGSATEAIAEQLVQLDG